ncbi:Aminopeptidase Ey [Clonorchis sinensis]|uniref:Aminopeptidase Ey n=1 Tax=Clonorchis sinensis TaxID=79923 RepID=A0A8T1MWM1_CLOSI|nr:Aminopeptidase Ey [Clonorchis sinensis]
MSAEEEKLTQKPPNNSVPDGQPQVDVVGNRRVRVRLPGWQVKLLCVIVAILVVLLLVLTGIASYYGAAYQRCEKESANEAIESDSWDSAFEFGESLDESARKPAAVRNVRLPFDVLPRFYNLRLQVRLHKDDTPRFCFNGSVVIKIYCTSSTDSIFVHAFHNLNVSLDLIKVETLLDDDSEGSNVQIKKITYDNDLQWYHILLQSKLEAGQFYRVTFGQFWSPLQTELKGWYLSSYDEGNVKKHLATSQLQPTDARRVFPCWDEPAFKAQFQVTLIRNKDYHSLSNMGLEKTISLGNNWYADVFYPTVNTSTYVLAFVVSQFAPLSATDSKGRNFTVWARPDVIHMAQYALETGRKIIHFFENYFEVPYPLQKTDMIAVPDFAAGAMENWGLMIYREPTMLWDPETGTAHSQQKVATVISHEIAHQWFGNLVTLTWWDDLWLNEGFASFAEVIGVHHVHPKWGMDEQTLVENTHKVLINDAMPSSRPIVQNVNYPTEINSIFDVISYSKGASVLRMMESFLGQETFRLGIKKYLSNHKFRNTVEDDLWKSLAEAAKSRGLDLDLKAIMDTWLRQMNYPLVTVEPIGHGLFQFNQSRYLDSAHFTSMKSVSPYNFEWQIPLTYGTPASENWEENEVIWLKTKSMIHRVDIDPDQWYVFNIKQAGFYRVNYPESNWRRLTQQLIENHTAIPISSRTQIIDDLFCLANRGNVSYEIFLNLTKYLEKEDAFVPWEAARRIFGYLLRMLSMDSAFGNLQAYIRTLVDRELRTVDWETMLETENHMKHLLRGSLAKLACRVGHRVCVTRAKQLYADWMAGNHTNRIPPSLRPTVYCTAIQWGGQLEWQFLHNQLKTVNRDDELSNIRYALPCTRDAWLLNEYITSLLSRQPAEQSEITEAISHVAHNPMGQIILWDHIREEWQQMISELDKDDKKVVKNTAVLNLLRIFSKRINMIHSIPSPQEIEVYYQFLEALHIVGMGKTASTKNTKLLFQRHFRDIFKRSESNLNWIQQHRDEIKGWLSKQVTDNSILL